MANKTNAGKTVHKNSNNWYSIYSKAKYLLILNKKSPPATSNLIAIRTIRALSW